ncbi:restriction endonuclease subunit S [Lentibacillus sp. N15]|uniref:restriction endonuclease subunit S n=1 Tax=Lentibacillus songyuanensis TaxID=3136161 RepID=UPI0031B9EDCF
MGCWRITWEQRKLGEVVNRVKSYALSRNVESTDYTGYKYIHYGDIHTKVAHIIDESSNLPNIKIGNYELLKNGDLVLADASEDYKGIASPAVITINVTYKLVSGLHTIALRPRKADSLFLFYLFNSPTFKRYGYKVGTGMKVFGISATNLLKYYGVFPSNIEQRKIGKFLKQLDDIIALHQRKLDLLKLLKKGFMQVMFPQKEENVPKLRFLDFDSEWEKLNVMDLSEKSFGGGTPKTSTNAYWNGEIPWIQSSDFREHQVSGVIANKKITDEGLKNSPAKLIPKNSIAVVTRVGVGKVALIPFEYTTSQDFLSLSYLKVDKWFGVYSLYNQLQKELNAVQGTSIKGITKNEVLEKKINKPKDLIEQKKIGHFLKQLDKSIALCQIKLRRLQSFKKAYLQKMFI